VYFINDQLQFSWTVKHGNGSYEAAKDLTISFHFPNSVIFSNLTGPGNYTNTTSKNGAVVDFTPTNNTLPIGMVNP
jgi:hypothetical protein